MRTRWERHWTTSQECDDLWLSLVSHDFLCGLQPFRNSISLREHTAVCAKKRKINWSDKSFVLFHAYRRFFFSFYFIIMWMLNSIIVKISRMLALGRWEISFDLQPGQSEFPMMTNCRFARDIGTLFIIAIRVLWTAARARVNLFTPSIFNFISLSSAACHWSEQTKH